MKKGVLLLVVCASLCARSAPTESEIVWLKDVSQSIKTDKRTLLDPDLTDDLTFHLRRGSQAVALNLKRNHGIDPNAEIYVVRKLNDGRYYQEKSLDLEEEDLAYYQDKKNGAFMTVRCVRRSNGQCYRVINGNVRIEERNYDLSPAETDITLRGLLDVPDLRGTRYVLRDQENIRREISVTNIDAENVNEAIVEQKLKYVLRSFLHGKNSRNHFPLSDFTLSSRHVAGLDNRDNVKQLYYVEIAVMLDSGIWDLFSSLTASGGNIEKDTIVKRKLRVFFSHIINGVNLLYQGIRDPSIDIRVTLRTFHIFPMEKEFPHKHSLVESVDGEGYIDASKYLKDIARYAKMTKSYSDHLMLFTTHAFYDDKTKDEDFNGLSYPGMICHDAFKVSLIGTSDYFLTMTTAAHELAHNLGADHDGMGNAKACRANDSFIMSPTEPVFQKGMTNSRNPWIFSNCSVDVFKDVLKSKTCLRNVGVVYNKVEWKNFMTKLPGQIFLADEQCKIINGPRSSFCGTESPDICRFMECIHPETGLCKFGYSSAASGTKCGDNAWCIQGMCVSKASK